MSSRCIPRDIGQNNFIDSSGSIIMTLRKYAARSGGQHQAPIISSRGNPIVKAIRALGSRKERTRTGLFFVEGLRLVTAAARQDAAIEACVVAPRLMRGPAGHDLLQSLQQRGVPCIEVSDEVFLGLAEKEQTHGIGAVVRQRWETLARIGPGEAHCWVALEAVQYPGNLGTVLRTCDAVGGAGVILLGNTADPYDPAAVRASLGAVFWQRLVRAGQAEFADWKRQHGYTVVDTSPAATLDYQAIAYQPPLVLLMGSEGHGLSHARRALCDMVVTIPMVGLSDSLNLAVATSVVLYEMFNQCRTAVE
jgi:RNA methyltransferase, TrmH family